MFKRAGELFAELKSETRPRDLVRRMSGGQRQAVAIARTRLSDPKIVLMDEPTAAISVRQVAEVLNLIRRLRDHGIAVVLISHRMPDVFAVADRIVVLRRGEKVADKADRRQLAGGGHRPHHRRDRDGLMAAADADDRERGMAMSLEDAIGRRPHGSLAALARQPADLLGVGRRRRWPSSSCRSRSDVFATQQNLFNVTRNFAFVAHHRARHDRGHHHRRHRPVGRLGARAVGHGHRHDDERRHVDLAGGAAGARRVARWSARSTAC